MLSYESAISPIINSQFFLSVVGLLAGGTTTEVSLCGKLLECFIEDQKKNLQLLSYESTISPIINYQFFLSVVGLLAGGTTTEVRRDLRGIQTDSINNQQSPISNYQLSILNLSVVGLLAGSTTTEVSFCGKLLECFIEDQKRICNCYPMSQQSLQLSILNFEFVSRGVIGRRHNNGSELVWKIT